MSNQTLPDVADEVTVRARIEEAQLVHTLPALVSVQASTGVAHLMLIVADTVADLIAWSDRFGMALTASLERHQGKLWTAVKARGELLGWTLVMVSVSRGLLPLGSLSRQVAQLSDDGGR